jgi:outer membrane biosynthesis protein TonB/c-di-GMP-binding flagellar brake protein YcgR
MPDVLPRMPSKGPLAPERRQNPRHPVRPTEYIEIGDSNGGIILDISEGGMAVASAQALVGNQTLRFRFQLPRSLETIETSGEINWIGETKKRAGVRFVDLPLAAREQIHKWIDEQTSGHSNGDQKPNGSAVGSASPKIPRELPRYEPINRGAIRQESIIPRGQDHEDSTNLNPFSSTLSSPLDEPEVDEAEAEDEEKVTADSNAKPLSEKRAQTRFPMTASTYVQLSDGNGGLMANLSKTGFCVRAAKTLETDHLPVVRFQLPNARDFVESSAWIVWKSVSKKAAGARFENLSAEAQAQIAQWIDAQPLPKTAPTKNLLSKNPLVANAPVKSPLEQREKISPSPKVSAPVTSVPVTLMASDSVPIPAYISPLAISLNAKPAVSSSNSPSAAPPLSKAAPSAPPSKAPPAPTVKPPAPLAAVPRMVSAPSPAKPAMSASTPGLPKSQKSVAAAPFVPALPVAPPIINEPDWSVAPKRPTGYWKIAAAIVVAAGILFGGATLLRSKKSATPLAQETAQNSAAAATGPATNPSTEATADSAPTNSAPANPSSSTSASNAGSSREFRDAPRNTIPAEISPKGDEQFVDEPRPASSRPQISSTPIQNNAPSSTPASEQPATSRPAPVQSSAERSQNPPGVEGSGFPEVVHRAQAAPAPVSSNTNDVANAAPKPASPRSQAASSNQQPDANLAAAGVTQNSSTPRPVAASESNSSPRATAPSNNPSQTVAAGAPASSTAAAIPNPVPTVSVFTRFRAIRSGSDAARPAGSDLQIGRLKSGPAPAYPVEALRQQIQGIVELEVLVGADGSILTVHLVKGPPELASVAMGTVRSWQYGQTTLGGKPVETDQSIYFTFKLTK